MLLKVFSADSIEPTKSKHKPLEANLKDALKMSMNNKYIKTNLDTSFDTFVEAIAKKHHVVNECWIDTIVDVYGDSLMSSKRKEIVTRETILEIIGKTEDTVKYGISIYEMELQLQYQLILQVQVIILLRLRFNIMLVLKVMLYYLETHRVMVVEQAYQFKKV